MKALKTIVATVVIVFALTTVAMAGVQHLTKAPSVKAAGRAPVHFSVALTTQHRSATHVSRAHLQASAANQGRYQAQARHAHRGGGSGQGVASHQSSSHHEEPTHHTYASGNGHSGGCGDGAGQCGD